MKGFALTNMETKAIIYIHFFTVVPARNYLPTLRDEYT
jgi:hypothetical protein